MHPTRIFNPFLIIFHIPESYSKEQLKESYEECNKLWKGNTILMISRCKEKTHSFQPKTKYWYYKKYKPSFSKEQWEESRKIAKMLKYGQT